MKWWEHADWKRDLLDFATISDLQFILALHDPPPPVAQFVAKRYLSMKEVLHVNSESSVF